MGFEFQGELWEHAGETPWVFVTVPQGISDEIEDLAPKGPGFGSVRVVVTIGGSEWTTSLFPSKELQSYVLPIKRPVRLAEDLDLGEVADISLRPEALE